MEADSGGIAALGKIHALKSGVNKATSVCTHVRCYTYNNVFDTLLGTKFSLPFEDLIHHGLFLWT